MLDLAFGDTPYFSIDAGATNLATFATGRYNGDGDQASHWKDSLNLGQMDPTLGPAQLSPISNLDVQALDVIGYDVPEPASLALLAAGAAVTLLRRRKRKLA